MKFSNGCWLNAESVNVFGAAQVYECRVDEDRVTLICPTMKIRTRGDTLGGVALTVEITAPMPGVLRVRTTHYAGVLDHGPAFELAAPIPGTLCVEETEDAIIARSGALSVAMDKDSADLAFFHGDRRITGMSGKDLAYVNTGWKGSNAYDAGEAWMRGQLDLGVDEHIYGLGERFGPFVKNGQSVDIWNEDGGTSTEQSYKNIPFYLSSRGYGVLVNHPERVSFEVGSEFVSKVGFAVKGESLDFMLIDGPSPKEVLVRYTDLTGKPAMPAPWTFGLWLSTSFTTDYDEKTVSAFVDGMAETGIPLSVFHFDCYWMRGYRWCDFEFDPAMFPDPESFMKRLKDRGLRVCLWINPYIAQASPLFEEGAKAGYFLKRRDGSVWQWDMWQPGMALVDFTNPAARDWFAGKLAKLVDIGADCFKTDFGERVPTDAVYFDGSDPEKMHNYYTYLYNKTVRDVLVAKKGEKDAFLFARSATVGGQKMPVHWGGDCWSSYEAMEQSLRGGLSLTTCGFGFWSHDIGGFEKKSTADVYKRWLAFGLLSTHSRLHGSETVRVPWSYDEEAVDVCRFFTRLKARLMPYLYRNAWETHTTGVPMMRAMVLEFPEDRNCAYLANQYMLGDSLLVAPVLNDRGQAEYYLPEGSWTHVLTGEVKQGGRWVSEPCGYLSVPLFARPGSIVAMGAKEDGPEYDYADGVTFRAYAAGDGLYQGETCVIDGDCRRACALKLEALDGGCRVTFEGEKPCAVALVNAPAPKAVDGAAWTVEDGTLVLRFEKGGAATVAF